MTTMDALAETRADDVDAPAAAENRSGSGPGEMSAREADAFLARHRWGLLSTVDADGRPYAVPVSYGWDGAALFVATGPGRKLRNLEANGAACLTVAEVVDGSRWRCVVASGIAVPVTGMTAVARALTRIALQQGTVPSRADLARGAKSRVFRLHPDELTGRERG
jgi:nitroimidazol reductase NimA-like FMN-containing flavoprotein (pyridoxamine 5'-phosphate oxidase superfamily)